MKALIENAAPVDTVTELTFKSHPDVPTEPSITRRPVAFWIENHAAVPPAAVESCVMVFAVMTPAAAAPNALVDGKASEATTVFAPVVAAEVSAGCVPA